MLRRIVHELREHAPFTALGAATGIIIMVIIVLTNVTSQVSEATFDILHPLHLLLSAIVTTAMYKKYGSGKLWAAILIGYFGTIIPCTISDALIPYLGGAWFAVQIKFEVPFIEVGTVPFIGIQEWLLVNSAVSVGIIIGYLRPTTKFPHAGHVLLLSLIHI